MTSSERNARATGRMRRAGREGVGGAHEHFWCVVYEELPMALPLGMDIVDIHEVLVQRQDLDLALKRSVELLEVEGQEPRNAARVHDAVVVDVGMADVRTAFQLSHVVRPMRTAEELNK